MTLTINQDPINQAVNLKDWEKKTAKNKLYRLKIIMGEWRQAVVQKKRN